MPAGKGKIVLMGSGELTSTMVEVHRSLLDGLADASATGRPHSGDSRSDAPAAKAVPVEAPRAAFLDTPAGFQLNADQISERAVDYFQTRVQRPMVVASFKSSKNTTDFEAEEAFRVLRGSSYILIGPGSPTYAVRQWKDSPVPEILTECITAGGCLVAASAAALTVGRFTLPVYEIYKVGEELRWVEGMDVMGRFGFDLVVIPHWNNAEGGTHDTRFCFVGGTRFRQLVDLLEEPIPILGLDEHTACILNLQTDEAEIRGIGSITYRRGAEQLVFNTGETFRLDVLRGGPVEASGKQTAEEELPPTPAGKGAVSSKGSSFWDHVHRLENDFQSGLTRWDVRTSTNALLELDRRIWQAQTDLVSPEVIVEARDTLRELIALLGSELGSSPRTRAESLKPLVDELIRLRQELRADNQWQPADAIRDALHRAGIVVEDEKNGGSRWKLR
jgi:hypothetical protein